MLGGGDPSKAEIEISCDLGRFNSLLVSLVLTQLRLNAALRFEDARIFVPSFGIPPPPPKPKLDDGAQLSSNVM